jgi:GNAT superfamily N-acetyltransferase
LNHNLDIRLARKEDVGDIIPLWLELMKETYPEGNPSPTMFATQMMNLMDQHNGYTCFIALDGKNIVGFIDGIVIDDPIYGCKAGRGLHFYVKPEYRKTLVAISLFSTQEKWGEKYRGAKVAKLNCIPSQRELYEKMGYKPIEFLMYKKLRD